MRQAHAGYFLALAEQAEPELFGPEQNTWLARLEEEHDNLRAAFAQPARADDPQPGLRLAGALWRFWEVRGHLAEGQAWLNEMLRRAGAAAEPAVRAKALLGAGVCAYYQRNNGAASATAHAKASSSTGPSGNRQRHGASALLPGVDGAGSRRVR